MRESKRKTWGSLSVIFLIIGIGLWLPNLLLQEGYGFWIFTFVVHPLGALFGFLAKNKFAKPRAHLL